MEWTTERPTADGLYWLDCVPGADPSIASVDDGMLWFIGNDGFYCVVDERFDNALWYGPIAPPKPLPPDGLRASYFPHPENLLAFPRVDDRPPEVTVYAAGHDASSAKRIAHVVLHGCATPEQATHEALARLKKITE